MRVLVADRQAALRSAVKTFLEQKLELVVVGEAHDSQTLLAQVEATNPGIVFLDWELPGQPAAELLAALRVLDAQLKVIVLGNAPEQQPEALAAGADYYVGKDAPPRRLLTAVYIVQLESEYA